MNFDFENFIGKFKYDPNSVKKNYDGKTDIYLAKVSYRYAYVKRILAVLIVILVIAFVLSGNISYRRFYYLSKDIKLENDTVNFLYSGKATELTRELSALSFEDLTICDPDLDEVFMHYYAKEEG